MKIVASEKVDYASPLLQGEGEGEDGVRTFYPLYREWLPVSGEKLRDFPLFFRYVNLMPEVAEHELVTEVYLPLK